MVYFCFCKCLYLVLFAAAFQNSLYSDSGVGIAQWLAFALPDPAVPGSILGIPQKISEKIINVAKVNQQHYCFEQWLNNVDQTHLALASGKLVIQKRQGCKRFPDCFPLSSRGKQYQRDRAGLRLSPFQAITCFGFLY